MFIRMLLVAITALAMASPAFAVPVVDTGNTIWVVVGLFCADPCGRSG
jgi:hypothetical protein